MRKFSVFSFFRFFHKICASFRTLAGFSSLLLKKEKTRSKGVPYKGFFETLKIYRKLHFQAVKRKLELGYIVQVLFL